MKKMFTLALTAMFALGSATLVSAADDKKKPDPAARFKKLDKNSDNKLSLEEFTAGAKDKAKAEKAFANKDKDKDKNLSLEEFSAAPAKKKK